MELEYQQFALGESAERLSDLVRCYQQVFATNPWREWCRCDRCGKHWGIEDASELEQMEFAHCGLPVAEYWPADQVQADLERELSLPGAICWLAICGERIVGFCHGYPLELGQLEYNLKLPGLAAAIIGRFGAVTRVAYQDDMGVLQAYRGRHIGSELFRRRQSDFARLGLEVGVVRTMTDPPTVTYQWYTAIGYTVVASYRDENSRVVLARTNA